MFDRYIIVEDSLKNVTDGDAVIGFSFDARCGYYTRLILSMVEDLEVVVDGEPVPRDAIRLTVGRRQFTLDEMETEYSVAWEFGVPATVTVLRDGGLTPGAHEIGLHETLRISYMPRPREPRTSQVQDVA